MKLSKVRLHPHSFKYLSKGHPWVTKDSYTQKFPKDAPFLLATDGKKNQSYLLLHDPTHPQVAARLWSSGCSHQFDSMNFKRELKTRIENSANQRAKILTKGLERENYYLVFGEADQVPGLHILKLGPRYLIQYYTHFWLEYESHIIEILKELDPEAKNIWVQARGRKVPPQRVFGEELHTLPIKEFGVNYELRFNQAYDIGIYTDMASIREKILKTLPYKSVGLNLFCYTGAFSLAAMKHCHSYVTSVDLSRPYLDWLEKNVSLNSIEDGQHQAVQADCLKFLEKSPPDQYDWIICDPPTSSNNKKKRSNSFEFYRDNFERLLNALKPGGKLYLFLNTHSINRRQFKERINELIKKSESPVKIVEEFALGGDCPRLKGFPEGDYLKGLVLKT